MTAHLHDRGPEQQPGHSVLSRLIAIDAETFGADYWGQQPLLTQAADLPHDFSDLLSSDSVDELLSERGLRTPFLRVAKGGNTLGDRSFTAAGGIGAGIGDQVSDDKLVRLFAEGSTLVLQALHRVWPPIIAFSQDLAAELGHPVQVNAYVTPGQNMGFSDHYDVHDVFVLQIEGEKEWTIHRPVLDAPLRSQPWGDRRAAVEAAAEEEPLLERVLRPGDCLYLPRGYLHAAKALGGVSTHITIGIHIWTRHWLVDHLVKEAVSALEEDPQIRQSLPFGLSVLDASNTKDDIELVRRRLIEAVANVEAAVLTDRLRDAARQTQRAAPIGPLRQLRAATELEPSSLVSLRQHLGGWLEPLPDGGALLHSRAGEQQLSSAERNLIEPLLAGGRAPVAQLGQDFVRTMLVAGLVVIE